MVAKTAKNYEEQLRAEVNAEREALGKPAIEDEDDEDGPPKTEKTLGAEQLRKTEQGKEIYARRKETIERVFGGAREKHAMRYTQHRGLARVERWVRLKYVAMNLKKLATWAWKSPCFCRFWRIFPNCTHYTQNTAVFVN